MNKTYKLIFVLAFIGLLNASYLAYEHFSTSAIACPIDGRCDLVLTSRYAVMFGIPLALLGAIYYLGELAAAAIQLRHPFPLLSKFLLFYNTVGFLFSLYLVYLQAFVIHAYCIYCLFSAALATIIFILTFLQIKLIPAPEPEADSML